jgi:glycosyltransferase involved in cell wall biosynthesis
VSDNSGDPNKKSFLDQFDLTKSIDTTGLRESENWNAAFENADGDWVSFLSDDDWIFNLGGSAVTQHSRDVVGLIPSIGIWRSDKGIYDHRNFSIVGSRAKDRVEQYFRLARGNNNALFSFFRMDVRRSIQDLTLQHPMKMQGYNDWAITLAFIAEGNLVHEPSSLFVYNNQNWAGSQEDIAGRIEKLFVNVGWRKNDARLIYLLLGVDAFIAVMRQSSRIPVRERFDAAMSCLLTYLSSFISAVGRDPGGYSKLERSIWLEQSQRRTFDELFLAILKTISGASEEFAEAYLDFHSKAIGVQWGAASSLLTT